jgi:periplasmic divalent cation tolerance protein
VTASSAKEGKKIARQLVAKRLAACVNVIGDINSIFRWKGKVERSKEILLVIKTKKTLFSQVEKMVSHLSSYELPEVLALPVAKGKAGYLRWIQNATARTFSG